MAMIKGMGAAGATGFFRRAAAPTRRGIAGLEGMSDETLRDIGLEDIRPPRAEVDARVALGLMAAR